MRVQARGTIDDSEEPPAQTKRTSRHKLRPCSNCKEKHLRCDYDTDICRRCQRDRRPCDRAEHKLRFRKFATDSQCSFAKDQPWMKTTKNLRYIDETKLTAAISRELADSGDDAETDNDETGCLGKGLIPMLDNSVDSREHAMQDPVPVTQQDEPADTASNIIYRHFRQDSHTSTNPGFSGNSILSIATGSNRDLTNDGQPLTEQSCIETSLRTDANDVLSALERAILLRYFIQELALWFDICDPERHFGQSIPQRARSSRTLLNAICTASARHLVRLQKYRNSDGSLEWNGILLPRITQDIALELHNECIRDLLRYSADPQQVQNVDLLAASIVLRSDEEMDVPFQHGKITREVFLQVTSVFIEAQTPNTVAVPYPSSYYALVNTNYDTFGTGSDFSPIAHADVLLETPSASSNGGQSITSTPQTVSDMDAEGLRQACFWIALRQELHASFMSQRSFNFDLSKFDAFRNHSRASDAVWADRLVVFHAAVLEFCYPRSPNTVDSQTRWTELTQESRRLEILMPSSFQPIYRCNSSVRRHQMFPEIWYLKNCHVTASSYFELTRILLASFDPGRPKFGSGYWSSQREVVKISKSACIKLCGMAMSNKQAPPIHLNACAAIALCGEYFEDKTHRDALLWFLRMTEEEIGYPTEQISSKLTEAWSEA